MTRLRKNKIIESAEDSLSDTDKSMLHQKKNRQLRFIWVSYVPLSLILLFVFVYGSNLIFRKRGTLPKHEITEEELSMFNTVAPYFCGFMFLILSAYFTRFYLQSVAPFSRDIKENKKLLATVEVEKINMGMFNKYYILTPMQKNRQLLISKDGFESMQEGDPVVFEIAPNSGEILRVLHRGQIIADFGKEI
jgi:hypothetical protein